MLERDLMRADRHTEVGDRVSPVLRPSIQTSAHGSALTFSSPVGCTLTDRSSPGSISTNCVDVKPYSWLLNVSW